MIQLPWWGYVLFLMAVAAAIWGFLSLVKFRTRELTHKTHRTAKDLYPSYADSLRKQRRFAREHGRQWHDDGDRSWLRAHQAVGALLRALLIPPDPCDWCRGLPGGSATVS